MLRHNDSHFKDSPDLNGRPVSARQSPACGQYGRVKSDNAIDILHIDSNYSSAATSLTTTLLRWPTLVQEDLSVMPAEAPVAA